MTDPTRPPATGYPAQPTNGYPPPQQQQQQSSYYYPNHNPYHAPPPGNPYYPQQPPRATFFRRFMSILIFLFIIMGAILFIVWLVLRPRIPAFTVTSLSLSSLNLTSSSLSASWNAKFTVYNPNDKLHVYYDEIEARVSYKSSLLARNELPPFDQATKSQTDISAALVAAQAYINPGLGTSLADDHAKGSIKFNVQVLALVRFKSSGWSARRRFLRVFCDDLPVDVSPKAGNGTLSGGSRRCAVGI